MTPLTNPAVNANALETSVMKLWQEFLSQYFDGGKHAVGATPQVPFPAAELLFQQSAVTQPLYLCASVVHHASRINAFFKAARHRAFSARVPMEIRSHSGN